MNHDGPTPDPAWARLRALFESALDLPPDERADFAARACAGEHELLAGLLDLLAGAEQADLLRPAAASDLALGFVGWQPRPGERMGAYRIERRIASGGMGSVYEARQDQPARSVALKVMHAAVNEDASLRRFQHEAEALGRLQHHGIGAIYELGFHTTAEGLRVPFFALELIEDARDLISHAREEKLDLDARLRLLIEVCAAVEHAHQKGVVHRDLKPANILVGASGVPKVIDYGIARLLEGDGGVGERTQAGVMLGTLQYMSPEQLSDTPGGVDTRADVYALGAVLYELVCGVPVYVVGQRPLADVVREVCAGMPQAPTMRTPGLPRELDWVVLKCLEREPAQRYGSAHELALDLQRMRDGEPLSAGPTTRRYRVAKFVARHRVGVALVSLTVAALLTSVVSSSVALRRVRAARAAEALQARAAAGALRRQTAVVDSLGEILGAVAPDEDGRNVTLFALLERKSSEVGARLADDPILQATLQGFLAQAYINLGLSEEALELARSSEAALMAAPDADPNELARVRVFLARRALELGRFEEARVALELGLVNFASLDGLQSADGVAALRTHAMVLERSGTLAQSLAAYRRAADVAGSVLGDGHELTMVTRSELATVLNVAGESETAELLARGTYERALADFGPDSQVTLQTGMRLGTVLHTRGKFVEVLPLQRSITAGIARLHGESHRNHAQALCALTQALLANRELGQAEAQALLAVELRERHHPKDVDLEILTLATLASVLEVAGRYSEARDVLAKVVERLEQAKLLAHPSGVQFLTRLGEAYLALDARADAQVAFEQALSHAVGVFEPEHPWVKRANNGLARATR